MHAPIDKKTLEAIARSSGNPWRPQSVWFERAELHFEPIWHQLIWPFIWECDFTHVVDLAAGCGRNTAYLIKIARRLTIIDIQPGNVAKCRDRFADAPIPLRFYANNGYDMRPVEDNSVTLVYCFDSMVHFDSDIVRSYLRDTARVLAAGGRAFFHHSNSTFGIEWQKNPHGRNFMTTEIFRHYAEKEGLRTIEQKIIPWAQIPDMDCLSLVEKPEAYTATRTSAR